MGALNQPDYDSLDYESETKGYKQETKAPNETETIAGALKHNVSIGTDAGTTSRKQQVGQPTAREPESTMANNLDPNSDAAAIGANDQQLVNALMGKTFDEKPIYAELWESIRDVFFLQNSRRSS